MKILTKPLIFSWQERWGSVMLKTIFPIYCAMPSSHTAWSHSLSKTDEKWGFGGNPGLILGWSGEILELYFIHFLFYFFLFFSVGKKAKHLQITIGCFLYHFDFIHLIFWCIRKWNIEDTISHLQAIYHWKT